MEPENKNYRGERVRLCKDGKYRWTYSLNMYRNPAVLLVVLKIFGIIFGIAMAIMFIPMILRGEWSSVLSGLKIWAIVLAVFLAICALAYLIVAGQYGGRYVVDFTMDEKGLEHSQTPVQAKKARKMAAATVIAGTVAGRPGTAGAGLMATRTELSSEFAKVRKVKPCPGLHMIKVNERFTRNQVYVPAEDFDFVLGYIREHCPRLK